MARASRVEWAKRVERWKDSGLTAKEFAGEAGLKASTLSYWKWKLGSEASSGEGPRRSRERGGDRAPMGGSFIEVTTDPVSVAPGGAAMLELVLGGSMSVRVPVGFDDETLRRVVRAVGGTS